MFLLQEQFMSRTGSGTAESQTEAPLSTTVVNTAIPPGGSTGSFRPVKQTKFMLKNQANAD